MKARLGDTVILHAPIEFKALSHEELGNRLRESFIWLAGGPPPKVAGFDYRDVVLNTPELVEEYNIASDLKFIT